MTVGATRWTTDKLWSDRFIPEIRQLIGPELITEAPAEEDALRNTDLITLKMDSYRIGCRVRHPEDYKKYRHQFTLRSTRPSGAKTELAKVIEGWGDYFFYGWSDDAEVGLQDWLLGDLKVFRLAFATALHLNAPFWHIVPNDDGSSQFHAFDIDKLPKAFIRGRSPVMP